MAFMHRLFKIATMGVIGPWAAPLHHLVITGLTALADSLTIAVFPLSGVE